MGALQLVLQPQAFFHELITEAMEQQKLTVRAETEFYLVNLLNQFMLAENLTQEPLALLLKTALEEPHPAKRSDQFRRVGDLSLYVAGYFQDSLNRKLVDVDYYIEMGGSAYVRVASQVEERSMRATYDELAEKFPRFVDVLAQVSEKTQAPRTEKDLLRLYDIWVKTKSERAAKQLQEAGILPNANIKKEFQS